MVYRAVQNLPAEWGFHAHKDHADPFNELELDVIVTGPDGGEMVVPAYWAGGREWRVRFASPKPGLYRWRSRCTDETDSGLHGLEGEIEVVPFEGSNPLLRHGPLRVAASGRHLEHADGTPFFWLGDTWWMGLCRRLKWPSDFQVLAADRVAKGFTVIQIVAGLYPDMGAFDERGANEAGFPWQPEWARINPAYFDMADLRIYWLVRSGLVPCIVGCWGYYLPWLGVERMKKHWRYIVARWGAYPVVWCMAGEVLMPWYLGTQELGEWHENYSEKARAAWSEVAAYVRNTDPYRRPVTAHPNDAARRSLEDDVLDFDMLQTGHGDRTSLPNTVNLVTESYTRQPVKPVINGEVCYEGIGEASRQEVQRLMFWACMLSGACGHTYGANGIWQVNERDKPYGPSPHGMAWGDTPWEEAFQLPGSGQLGIAKALLERYRWWKFEPHPEWVEPHWTVENYFAPYAGGIPEQVRIVYWPVYPWTSFRVVGLEPGVRYRAYYFDPKNGREYEVGAAEGDGQGAWAAPRPKLYQDWILVLEADGARV